MREGCERQGFDVGARDRGEFAQTGIVFRVPVPRAPQAGAQLRRVSRKAGRHVLFWLFGQGYEILNFDLQPFANPDIFSVVGDVTDSGQVFNAMAMHFGGRGLQAGRPPGPVDTVVHFAAIPSVFIKADNETYRVNVMGTYNVIEAAMKLGIRKVVRARMCARPGA